MAVVSKPVAHNGESAAASWRGAGEALSASSAVAGAISSAAWRSIYGESLASWRNMAALCHLTYVAYQLAVS